MGSSPHKGRPQDPPAAGDAATCRRLILASASPRRQELLREAGYEFIVHPAEVDEDSYPASLLPAELARFLALAKASAVAERFPDDLVLGADTVVAFGDLALGKPADADDARRMLMLLSGTTQVIITGLALICRRVDLKQTRVAMSAARMRRLTGSEIEAYVKSGLWEGKAGGYGIQDNDPFVTRMTGSHTNIVGLPMEAAREMLAAVGIEPRTR
jgi:septum formation protein